MLKDLIKILICISIIVHCVFSYVVGTLNPFEFTAVGRFFEVFVIGCLFLFFIENR